MEGTQLPRQAEVVGEGWSSEDRAALVEARRVLERPSFAVRVTDVIGAPVQAGLERLPAGWRRRVERATGKALSYALDWALTTMEPRPRLAPALSRKLHRLAVGATGAAGGAFGLATALVELPLTTGLMLRSIADVARAEGEQLGTADARLACLEVFALGGRAGSDDSAETGYFAVRIALARSVNSAATHVAAHGLTDRGAPALARLLAAVAQRFAIPVSQKVAAAAVPVVGALGGAAINVLFIDHFQSMARGHFTVRRLERRYGAEEVRRAYAALGAADSRA